MTQQTIRESFQITDDKCATCEFNNPTALFDLCSHTRSAYSVDGRDEQHTIQHMRSGWGECGQHASLRRVKA